MDLVQHFDFNRFKPNWQVWFEFICVRLLPVSHLSQITLELEKLLYCVPTRKSINVGQMIHNEICQLATTKQSRLSYPYLITALCLGAGVARNPVEERLKVGKQIVLEGVLKPYAKRTHSHASTSEKSASECEPRTQEEILQQILQEQQCMRQQFDAYVQF
ncbi:hypothetical protein ACH5RR_038986 [Cinchona calisaya]|uniref:Putative plant transposon protein domain-containing protein n=1 Tax=Cinchona calisaya TaxID=153742 RepID=A0ABD2Y2H7_9GENT